MIKKVLVSIFVLALIIYTAWFFSHKESISVIQQVSRQSIEVKKTFISIDEVTQEDMLNVLKGNKDQWGFFQDGISRNMVGVSKFANYPYFILLSTPVGVAGEAYQPFYLDKGELKITNINFITAGSAGIWNSFGYSKQGDFFYQAAGFPSHYSEQSGTPCGFTKYIWDSDKMEFQKKETVKFSSLKDDQCSDKFAEHEITTDMDTY